MPQPTGPQDAEAFVGRSHDLAVLSAALRQATMGDARLALMSGEPGIGCQSVRTGTRCSYSPPNG